MIAAPMKNQFIAAPPYRKKEWRRTNAALFSLHSYGTPNNYGAPMAHLAHQYENRFLPDCCHG